ncbi:hypothetical protein A2899_03365 [Candidatus Amesbacteria bacterium RIFCSPLOWO2_01_FULL_49_25]|uniref:Uncharacterized protein n=1 Tax=Candidatus Amesbacteria bacterium RIFCSPHIGHO2_01_FULL_48_32b TaxID=1797253 RepID=A0A1F4YEJ8_9BACT|nr:MAG: hypothetical protein A2876_02295 [Candidatus Amesbacteria bacterium RIFCSPHIGHO2_01_FULL_48_32b]OGD06910.1 MAG: hypothetical protein A2899_03365 [Candidatus Amesbacteria bacterium RIFCSPLOWO2_01_FULL_49_25]
MAVEPKANGSQESETPNPLQLLHQAAQLAEAPAVELKNEAEALASQSAPDSSLIAHLLDQSVYYKDAALTISILEKNLLFQHLDVLEKSAKQRASRVITSD